MFRKQQVLGSNPSVGSTPLALSDRLVGDSFVFRRQLSVVAERLIEICSTDVHLLTGRKGRASEIGPTRGCLPAPRSIVWGPLLLVLAGAAGATNRLPAGSGLQPYLHRGRVHRGYASLAPEIFRFGHACQLSDA